MAGRSNARTDFVLVLTIATAALVAVLAGMLVRDQGEELGCLAGQAQSAWGLAQTCLMQRNAILNLSLRHLSRERDLDQKTWIQIRRQTKNLTQLISNPMPDGDFNELLSADRTVDNSLRLVLRTLSQKGTDVSRFAKLADMLASSQNRVALTKLRYQRRAKVQRMAMETFAGAVVSRLYHIPRPFLWS